MTVLEPLLQWYAAITPQTIPRAAEYYAADARFRDPFNDVRGVPAIETIFQHMFASTGQPRFVIVERIAQGDQAFVTWRFLFTLHDVDYEIEGGSHLRFNQQGLVSEHRDYWDTAEELLQKLPLVGPPIRWLRGRFKAS